MSVDKSSVTVTVDHYLGVHADRQGADMRQHVTRTFFYDLRRLQHLRRQLGRGTFYVATP